MNVKENICGLISGMRVLYICLEVWWVLRQHLTTDAFWRSFKPETQKGSRHANHPNDMLLQYGLQRLCFAYYLKMTCFNNIPGAIKQLQNFTLKMAVYLSQFEEDTYSQPTNQSTDQTTDQPTNRQINQQTNRQINQPTKWPTNQPTKQRLTDRPNNNRPTDQLTNQPTNQSTDQTTDQPTNQQTDQPTNRPNNQPSDRSTNQPTNQPSNRPTNLPTLPLTHTPY